MAKIDLEQKARKVYTGADLDGFKRRLAGYIVELRRALGRPPERRSTAAALPGGKDAVEEAPRPKAGVEAGRRPPPGGFTASGKLPGIYVAACVAAVVAICAAWVLISRRRRS